MSSGFPFDNQLTSLQPPDIFTDPSPSNIIITSSFGHILPTRLLNTHFPSPPTRLNVHPSLLPQYRGAAPIQWAIARQDVTTGVSVQSLAMGGGKMVDHGELWAVKDGIVSPAWIHCLTDSDTRRAADRRAGYVYDTPAPSRRHRRRPSAPDVAKHPRRDRRYSA
jgi:hypothetical protein